MPATRLSKILRIVALTLPLAIPLATASGLAGTTSRALAQDGVPVNQAVNQAVETVDAVFEAQVQRGDAMRRVRRDLTWTVTDLAAGTPVLENFNVGAVTIALAPGRYRVEVVRGRDQSSATVEVDIAAGQDNHHALTLDVVTAHASLRAPGSAVAGSTVAVQWEGPGSVDDRITVARRGQTPGQYETMARAGDGSPLALTMPAAPGDYEYRYVGDDNGEATILARQAVSVTAVAASITAVPEARRGATVDIEWDGPDYERDYIAVARTDSRDSDYESYSYTRDGSPASLVMPSEPGDYELRYVMSQGSTVLTRVPVSVVDIEARVSAPERAPAGSDITIEWAGPNYGRDFIAIARPDSRGRDTASYSYTRDGNPLTVTLPPEAGSYEVRYVMHQNATVLARQPIEVEPVSASITPLEGADAGETVAVAWTGPNYQRDYLAVAPAGSDDDAYETYVYTRAGAPAQLVMPAQPGDYEVRYVQEPGGIVLARQSVSVADVSATLDAPDFAEPSAEISVRWTGPGYARDFVAVAAAEAEPGTFLSFAYVRDGSPLTLLAPVEPGAYTLLYVMEQGSRVLSSRPLSVQ
jgi:Ca-activated chloride channel homolog